MKLLHNVEDVRSEYVRISPSSCLARENLTSRFFLGAAKVDAAHGRETRCRLGRRMLSAVPPSADREMGNAVPHHASVRDLDALWRGASLGNLAVSAQLPV
jgi:hypothetical protein